MNLPCCSNPENEYDSPAGPLHVQDGVLNGGRSNGCETGGEGSGTGIEIGIA